MMKTYLCFNESETARAREAARVTDWVCAIWDHDQYLRKRLKYEELPADVHEALKLARADLHEELECRGLNLEGEI
jgi:hypothetical protein